MFVGTLLLGLCFLIHSTCALLPEVSDSDTTNVAEPLVHVRASKNGVQLRILPLGASIVFGLQSSDGNGFRQDLRNQLTSNGYQVDYVGSNNAGSMVDNECEAWPGYVIDQVATKAESSIAFKPKLILLHVGTNDAVQNLDIQNAGQRLGVLIDRLFDAIPGVTVIASTLLPNANSNTQTNVNIYNRQIPELVRKRQTAGNHIAYVDFSSSLFGLSDLSDGTHPTDAGYHKMAGVWYQGILAANDRGWLKAPAKGIFNASDTSCNKVLPSHG